MANLSNIITPTNVLTASSTNTLSNKTISGASNTITNVSLSTGVTGTLPIANGGTGTTSTTFANLTTNVTGTLPVANGGTGATSLTANNVLLGNGTSAVQVVAPGTNGNVLTSNGTTWVSSAPGGGDYVKISTTNISSGVTFVDVTNVFSATYKNYIIVFNAVYLTSPYARQMRINFIDTTPTVISDAVSGLVLSASGSLTPNRSTSSSLQLAPQNDPSPSFPMSAVVTVINPYDTSSARSLQGNATSYYYSASYGDTTVVQTWRNSGYNNAFTGFRFLTESPATFASGSIIVYGMK